MEQVLNDAPCALTTTDNPFNPFTQFEEWNSYDELLGYNTSRTIAAIAVTSSELSVADYNLAVNDAIDEIIKMHTWIPYVRLEYDDAMDNP